MWEEVVCHCDISTRELHWLWQLGATKYKWLTTS